MIYAFIGPKTSGKSTACAYIESKLPDAVRVNFKDALVQEIKDGFPELIEQLEIHYNLSTPQLFIQKPPLMRALMQNYGTEVMRKKFGEDYWVDKWSEAIEATDPSTVKNFTTDDCRFISEAKRIKSAGGILIRLDRPDLPDNDMHPSEQEQKEIQADYTIDCTPGDLEGLYKELDRIIEKTTS